MGLSVFIPFFVGMGLLSLAAVPVLSAVVGFIFGVLWAVVYNITASLVGGVKLRFRE